MSPPGRDAWLELSVAADIWNELGRPDSELYRGVRLMQARDWRRRGSIALTEVERDFLRCPNCQRKLKDP